MKQSIFILILLTFFGWNCNTDKSNEPKTEKEKKTINTDLYSLKVLDDLHEKKTIKKHDMTLEEYINSEPNKVDSIRKVIYLLPFGNMKPEVEEIIQSEIEYLEAFFQLEVKILEKISFDSIKKLESIKTRMVSESDFDYYSKMKGGAANLTEQIQASSFMDVVMKENKPNDAIAVLGITEHDIYNPEYNFLYGISELKDGVGLVSTFRLIDYGAQTKYNIRKVVSKQIANMFSIPNVKEFNCLLNFHSNIEELYYGKFDISPRVLEKLKYAIGFDYIKRFEDLLKFWRKEENAREIEYYEECLKRLKKASH